MKKSPDIIDMIEQRRKSLNWSQAELARHSGIYASHLCTYLSRKKSPSIATIQPVLAALGMTGIKWAKSPHAKAQRR